MDTSLTALEVAVATTGSTTLSVMVSAEPLLTALITLGVSILTILSTEGVKLLSAYLRKKREEIENGKNSDSDIKKEE